MDLLESPWFFRMVEQQGRTPRQRLLAVFSVLDAWLAAPEIRAQVRSTHHPDSPLYHSEVLKDFLTRIATAARAQQPASLANQLLILLQGAIAEDLRNPEAGAIAEAGKAAQAIIEQACAGQRTAWRWTLGGIAASVTALVIAYPAVQLPWVPDASTQAVPVLTVTPLPSYSPGNIEAVLALQEQIAKGICPAPPLLAMTPGQATAYLNVINYRTPENPVADSKNLRAFLAWFEQTRMSECYQAPVNGHTTVAWVKH